MSTYCIRGGHNYGVQGANGILNEVKTDRVIYPLVIKYLRLDGNTVVDVTPGDTRSSAEDLKYGVNKSNSINADYFASIHLNAGGGHGSEVIYNSEKGKAVAERICAKLASLGFKNRGAKFNTRGLYEPKQTIAVANIIECFFLDSKEDVDLYNSLGAERIAKAIAEGIVGHDIKDIVPYCGYQLSIELANHKDDNVKLVQAKVGTKADGYFGNNTKNAVMTFQRNHGLKVDGYVGINTWNALFN